MRWALVVLWPMGATLVGILLATPLVSPNVYEKGFALPQFIGLLPIPVACAAAFFGIFHVTGRPNVAAAGYGWIVFASTELSYGSTT